MQWLHYSQFDRQYRVMEKQIHLHHRWAQAMTVIQVAIALAAITLITKKKWMQTGVYIAAAGSAVLAGMAMLHI